MSLSLITFSESSDSSDNHVPQQSNCFPNKNQPTSSNRHRPLSRFHLVTSVVRKINIGSEEPDLSANTNSNNTSPTFSNDKTFIYKNGRRIFVSGSSISPKNIFLNNNNSKKLDIHSINFDSYSDYESDSYYSYSECISENGQNNRIQNDFQDNTNTNNLPFINSENNQNIQGRNSKPNLSIDPNSNKNNSNIHINKNDFLLNTEQNPKQSIFQADDQRFDQYNVEREKKGFSFRGKSMKFTLSKYDGIKFSPYIEALVTGSKVTIINSNTHEILGSMKAKKKFSQFLIWQGCKYGKVIMEICYKSYDNVKPRSSTIRIFDQIFSRKNEVLNANDTSPIDQINNQNDSNPNILHSKRPKRGSFGMWCLDFGTRKVISSIKNTIIVDKNNNEYFILGKIAENTVSVEAANGMNPICVLGIAVSTYMNTKP